jgi:hypothetical protein
MSANLRLLSSLLGLCSLDGLGANDSVAAPVQGKIFVCDQCCFGWLQLASDLIDLQMSRLSISNGSRVVTEKLVSLKCL